MSKMTIHHDTKHSHLFVTTSQRYMPTRLWGYSGHVQTIFQGVISFFHCPLVDGKRFAFKAVDGATVTYDLYQPIDKHISDGKFLDYIQ